MESNKQSGVSTISAQPLRLTALRKTYGTKTALHISELTLHPHSFTCIVGKSGCGKTTLLRLLAGLETPDSGIITGLPPKTAPVFQEPRLMPWLTVKENIRLSRKARPAPTAGSLTEGSPTDMPNHPAQENTGQPLSVANHTVSLKKTAPPLSEKEKTEALLADLELTEAAGLYPRQLSGGMAQRVSLGRTLYYDPDLILMDEPFSALDYFTRRHLQDMVLHLFRNRQKTILLVTHDVEEALLLGDRILVMEQGAIRADFPVPLSRPRKAADPAFQKMRQQILCQLE